MKIAGLSNHQWPREEDEGSAKQQQIFSNGQKLKYDLELVKTSVSCITIHIICALNDFSDQGVILFRLSYLAKLYYGS